MRWGQGGRGKVDTEDEEEAWTRDGAPPKRATYRTRAEQALDDDTGRTHRVALAFPSLPASDHIHHHDRAHCTAAVSPRSPLSSTASGHPLKPGSHPPTAAACPIRAKRIIASPLAASGPPDTLHHDPPRAGCGCCSVVWAGLGVWVD
ncbi:hypothetical protein EJ06DRAFT_371415 [Trichodelitschia bisporula]|uniref:Uncharacterized protein n=1 Tax=Trichodelitschia bisporula TaxID=703511 RepID=A0A6G1I1P9_9PEZI|nr:hypothetical protein EJ06DRAFT_371415 [Trichodelitschia bisporula]